MEFAAGFIAGLSIEGECLQIDVVGDKIQISDWNTGEVQKFSRKQLREDAASFAAECGFDEVMELLSDEQTKES